jgi:6-phosphogluconolactonase (cycloisomerase 2 family)
MHCTRDRFLKALMFIFACAASAWTQDASILPTSLTFSSKTLGTTSSAQTVTLTNTDQANALAITSIVASGNFTETNTCGSGIAAGASCTVSVRFRPTATGTIDGSISVFDNAPSSPQAVGLTGTGIVQEGVSPASVSFGTVAVGQTSAAKAVKLTNHTSSTIAISSISASGDYKASPATAGGCASSLAAQASCTENVVFAPTELGAIDGSLIFDAGGAQQYVTLTGTGSGTAGSPITLTPSALAFGSHAVGTTSVGKSVTIKNTGKTSLALTFTASGGYSKSNPSTGACGSNLAAGASCTIDVEFSPAAAGLINGSVSVAYAGTDSPQVVSLTGTGIGQVTVSPSSIAFSSQQVSTTSAAQKVTVTNNSASAVSVTSIVKSSDFSETNTCGSSIAKGTSCTISVSFVPTKAGANLGSIVITDSASNSPQIVDLSGSGFLEPRFAYVANISSNTVSVYTVNATTGQLRNNGYVLAGTNPESVTVDPSGRFAYVANSGSNNISAYSINAITGDLTPVTGSPYAAGSNPSYMTVDPSGRFAYVANQTSNNISGFAIDGSTGALTPVTGSPFASGQGPIPIAIDPTGRFLYVGNEDDSPGGDVSGYTINADTGALTAMAGSPFLSQSGAFTIALAPSGKFGYVTQPSSGVTAFSINPTTGIPGAVAGSPFSSPGGTSMAIAPSGQFLYLPIGGNSLNAYSVNTSTGALTSITGGGDTGENPSSVTVDPSGSFVYVTNLGPPSSNPFANDIWIYAIGADGTPNLVKRASTQQGPTSLAFAGGSTSIVYTPTFAYVANSDDNSVAGYTIDADTGVLTHVSGSPFKTGAPSTSDPSPVSVAVDPFGRYAYVADFNGNGTTGYASGYTINALNGALTLASGSPFAAQDNPDWVTVDPSGRFVYVVNFFSNSISGYSIDSSAGNLTSLSDSPYGTGSSTDPFAATIDPSGQFLCVVDLLASQVESFSIDPTSGNLTAIGSASTGSTPREVIVDPSGQFVYVATQSVSGVYGYALSPSGSLTAMAGSPFAPDGQPYSIAIDPSGRFAYTANFNTNNVTAFTIDPFLGTLTEINGSPFAVGNEPKSVTVDESGSFVYVVNSAANDVSAFTIDQASGTLTAISGAPFKTGASPNAVTTTGTSH